MTRYCLAQGTSATGSSRQASLLERLKTSIGLCNMPSYVGSAQPATGQLREPQYYTPNRSSLGLTFDILNDNMDDGVFLDALRRMISDYSSHYGHDG